MPKLMTFYTVTKPDAEELLSDIPEHPLDLALHRYFPFPPQKSAEYEALLDFCVYVPVVEHYMDMEGIRKDYNLQENASWRREDKNGGIILNGAMDICIPSEKLDQYRREHVVQWPVTRRDEFAQSRDNALYAKLLANHNEFDFKLGCYYRLSLEQIDIVRRFLQPKRNLTDVFMYVEEMIGVPNPRWRVESCMCGRGKVGFYTNSDGFEFPALHCDHCSRWWHVTPNGYLRKHIPLKYPRHLYEPSKFTEDWLLSSMPRFNGYALLPFMNDQDKMTCFGDKSVDEVSPAELHSAGFYMRHKYPLHSASVLVYKYTKEELADIMEMMHEGPSNLCVRSILALDNKKSYFDWLSIVKHALMYYNQYKAHLAEWEECNREQIIRIREARNKRKAERLLLEKRYREETIPWDEIHRTESSLN